MAVKTKGKQLEVVTGFRMAIGSGWYISKSHLIHDGSIHGSWRHTSDAPTSTAQRLRLIIDLSISGDITNREMSSARMDLTNDSDKHSVRMNIRKG